MQQITINSGQRLGTMFPDHIIMTFISMFFFIPNMIESFSNIQKATEISHQTLPPQFITTTTYIAVIGFALYFCKDCIHGRSIAKRMLKLQVVNYETGEVASPLRAFVRNIFIVIWPIEAIVALANPSRRIGDMVAGTALVPFQENTSVKPISFAQVGLAVSLAYGIILLMLIPVQLTQNSINQNGFQVVEPSKNVQLSNEIELLLRDKFGVDAKPDVLIYDQTSYAPDKKFVSIIFNFESDGFNVDRRVKQLKSGIESVLFPKVPEGTFEGQIKFVYRTSTAFGYQTVYY